MRFRVPMVRPVRLLLLSVHANVIAPPVQSGVFRAGNVSVPIVSPLAGATPAAQFAALDQEVWLGAPPPLQV
jgi:hypothetical protein